MVTHRPQASAARNVSVPCGGHGLNHVTQSQANAAAGSGQWDSRVTSAWKGMCVDQLESSVRLTNRFFRLRLDCVLVIIVSFWTLTFEIRPTLRDFSFFH